MAHNPDDAPLFEYRVQEGRQFGRSNQYQADDVVVLTEHEAAPLGHVLEFVGPVKEGDESKPSPSFDATQAALDTAAELGVDLSDVTGTGADGRILVGDVEAAVDESDAE